MQLSNSAVDQRVYDYEIGINTMKHSQKICKNRSSEAQAKNTLFVGLVDIGHHLIATLPDETLNVKRQEELIHNVHGKVI